MGILHHSRQRHRRRGRERAGGRLRGSGGSSSSISSSMADVAKPTSAATTNADVTTAAVNTSDKHTGSALSMFTRLAVLNEGATEEERIELRKRFEEFRKGARHRRSAECEDIVPKSIVTLVRGPQSPSARHRRIAAATAWALFFATWALASYLMYLCEHDFEIGRRTAFLESLQEDKNSSMKNEGFTSNPLLADATKNFFDWLEQYGG